MMVYFCPLSTQELEAGRSRVQDPPELQKTLSEKRKGGGVGGRVEGIASQKVFSLYHLASVDWYELT